MGCGDPRVELMVSQVTLDWMPELPFSRGLLDLQRVLCEQEVNFV